MVALWPNLDADGQGRLIDAILQGPVIDASTEEDEQARLQRLRDREVFERLMVLSRLDLPALPKTAMDELSRLKAQYPKWEIADAGRAHFSTWVESGLGYASDFESDALLRMTPGELVKVLNEHQINRDGLLDAWRTASQARPGRAVALLAKLSTEQTGPPDVWATTFSALRQAVTKPGLVRRIMTILAGAPDPVLQAGEVSGAASTFLADVSKAELPVAEDVFWQLWRRLLNVASRRDVAVNDDHWVDAALNHPAGELALALLNVTFKRQLKVGQGIPADLRDYFDLLLDPLPLALRLARVILASRLVYVFAVDPEWTNARLRPFFDWDRSNDEAVAMWRGYSWHGQVNADLWATMESMFLDCFTPERLRRLGNDAGRLATMLMVVGVELPQSEPPADRVRQAIRAMTPEGRTEAISWICSRMTGTMKEDNAATRHEQRREADRLWRDRVRQWLRKVWPRDRVLIEPGTSAQFAEIAVLTYEEFDDAVDVLLPLVGSTAQWGYGVHELSVSEHPDRHPRRSLTLIGRLVALGDLLFTQDLRGVLNRIVSADPGLRRDPIFQRLDGQLRAVNR
jgi:hypothetical protein